jgi:hypothetical protein
MQNWKLTREPEKMHAIENMILHVLSLQVYIVIQIVHTTEQSHQ